MSIFTPTNQKLLTNIAVVKLSKGGKRFEVACYKNKVMNWREKTETDINEVLQLSDVVFINVSKGETAKKDIVKKCFGHTDMQKVCIEILDTGTLQMSEKERKLTQENLFKEIANIVADKCIDPETSVAHQQSLIETAMKELHFNVKPNKSAKQQALELIPQLSEILSIRRAMMRVLVTVPSKEGKKIRSQLAALMVVVEGEEVGQQLTMTGQVCPGNVKVLTDLVQSTTRGKGTVDVLCMKEVADGEPML